MKKANEILSGVRSHMGGHANYVGGVLPRLRTSNGNSWAIFCGDGRFDPAKGNAAYAKATGAALNFQISGQGNQLTDFEFCVAMAPDHSWKMMWHLDPRRQVWPNHALHHIHVEPGALPFPFSQWRVPFGQVVEEPLKVLEFIHSEICKPTSGGLNAAPHLPYNAFSQPNTHGGPHDGDQEGEEKPGD
jgi:hypothetical protein